MSSLAGIVSAEMDSVSHTVLCPPQERPKRLYAFGPAMVIGGLQIDEPQLVNFFEVPLLQDCDGFMPMVCGWNFYCLRRHLWLSRSCLK